MIADQCELDKFTVKEVLVLCQHTAIKKLKKEILLKDLCYDEALTYAKSLERAAKKHKKIEDIVTNRVNATRIKKNMNFPEKGLASNCERCWRINPHKHRAMGAKCYMCNRNGHFAVICRIKRTLV